MTKLEKLKETFTEKEYAILNYFLENSEPLENSMIVPSNYRSYFGTDDLCICPKRQIDVAEALGVTPTSVSRTVFLLSTYQLVTKIKGIKGYIVNKTWLNEEYENRI